MPQVGVVICEWAYCHWFVPKVSHLVKYLTLYQIEKEDRPSMCVHVWSTTTTPSIITTHWLADTDVVRALNFDGTKEITTKCTLYMQFTNNGEEDFTVRGRGQGGCGQRVTVCPPAGVTFWNQSETDL